MITGILLIFGALTFSLIAVLVGLLGARRKIGFGGLIGFDAIKFANSLNN